MKLTHSNKIQVAQMCCHVYWCLNEHDARVQLMSIKHVKMEVMNVNLFLHVIFETNLTLETINVKLQK
jgi:hypothetical protein